MLEIQKILKNYEQQLGSQERLALASVVRVEGSSYRRPGARMLIMENGRWIGSISGGCLEGHALKRSREVLLKGRAATITYDTMNDESAKSLGVGLGCNGIIDVLIEPLIPQQSEAILQLLRDLAYPHEPMAMATVYPVEGASSPHLQRFLLNANGRVLYDSLSQSIVDFPDADLKQSLLRDNILEQLKKVLSHKKPAHQSLVMEGQVARLLMEYIPPVPQLLIFGGGFDASPVVHFAKQLGWLVKVNDDCIAHVGTKRFPEADEVNLLDSQAIPSFFNFHEQTAALVMSHNYTYDKQVIKALTKDNIGYLGLLGPRKRWERIRRELEQEGVHLSKSFLEKVHSPVGLDLGAENPEEIALSIIAEIKAWFAGAKGHSLREKEGTIHDRNAYDPTFLRSPKQVISNG